MPDDDERGKAVKLLWLDLEAEEIVFANQLLVQHHGTEFILSFGQFTPPPLVGSDEDKRQMLESIDFLPIRPVARIGLTAQRMTEFVRVMQENLSNYEQARGTGDDDALDE
jgi:hypothetical protein